MNSSYHPNTAQFVNIAYYKFVQIAQPYDLRQTLLNLCNDLNIKGTILLAHEGINSCLVGPEAAINAFISFMHNLP